MDHLDENSMHQQGPTIYARIRRPRSDEARTGTSDAFIESLLKRISFVDTPAIRETYRLLHDWTALSELYERALRDGVEFLLHVQLLLHQLSWAGLLEFATAGETPLAILATASSEFTINFTKINRDRAYRLSRFAYLRRGGEGALVLESPKAYSTITLLRPEAMQFLYELCKGTTVNLISERDASVERDEIEALFQFLAVGAIIEPANEMGVIPEEQDPALRQWEFHDLLFHSRSRTGRSNLPMGGTFRFRGQLGPQPAVKPKDFTAHEIVLPQPDINSLMSCDLPLTQVQEKRRSIRTQGETPITIQELGHFLYRVGRVKDTYKTDVGEFTRRPYPSGGASYELEFYLTVDRCGGLERGFYYYDPVNHALIILSSPTEEMEMLIDEAQRSAAMTCRPQVLLTIASRFQRVSWKYQGIAYALQLKNVGVVYAIMYLVAIAMNLAPCALGLGNTDRFCKLAGTDYYREGSIGEFILGSSAAGV